MAGPRERPGSTSVNLVYPAGIPPDRSCPIAGGPRTPGSPHGHRGVSRAVTGSQTVSVGRRLAASKAARPASAANHFRGIAELRMPNIGAQLPGAQRLVKSPMLGRPFSKRPKFRGPVRETPWPCPRRRGPGALASRCHPGHTLAVVGFEKRLSAARSATSPSSFAHDDTVESITIIDAKRKIGVDVTCCSLYTTIYCVAGKVLKRREET